ncbi:PIG-L family deacetylase [Acidovorax sp. SUPP3434]|uniref:PIG-L deacetylase family protein n=1 Tax=Acidovorax sp. SUPP3434 TaxID=2920880 RepID=UPI0023DE2832|nr:PIG-L deacetylase family protein [Acidovorax sp. SUPP3434]GKT00997.1 PIG-L family deacetylase [Acidovorax sp. SUPP3434]
MDAVIASHKPAARRLRAVPARTPVPAAPQPRLLPATPESLVAPFSRVVVVAPHPDDEVLVLGGTVAQLARRGHEVLVYAVTDGEASHPGSHAWPAERLRHVRPQESADALAQLGIAATVVRLGLPDGGLAAEELALAAHLQLAPGDTVFVPWRHDGHPDHEACARAALAAARTVGACCIEYPVWALVPEHAAHARLRHRTLRRIAVADDLVQAKARAVRAFQSQIQPDGGVAPVLPPSALQAWSGRFEWAMA